jgi:photosystem II stability/assembly factor-like uncharacterized protein
MNRVDGLLKAVMAVAIILKSFSVEAQVSSYYFCNTGFAGSPWTSKGQNPIPSDRQDIGVVYAVAAHPDYPQTIYIGAGRKAGLWKTTDGGNNWVNKTDYLGIAALGIHAIAIHPTDPNLILAGTFTSSYDWEYYDVGMGVLKSTDGGNTWQATNIVNFPERGKNIKVIRFHPTNPNIVLAAGNKYIYKSTDAGSTWTIVYTYHKEKVHAAGAAFIDIEFLPSNPNIVLASTDWRSTVIDTAAHLFLSTNTGSNWTDITPSDAFGTDVLEKKWGATAIAIDVTPADPNNFYIMYQNDCYVQNIQDTNIKQAILCIKKTINETNWTQLAQFNSSNITSFSGWSSWDKYEFEVSNTNLTTFYAGGLIMHRSTTSGSTWEPISEYVPGTLNTNPPHTTHADIRSLIQLPSTLSGDCFLMGNDGGVAKTIDGGTTWWDLNGNGLTISECFGVGVFSDNDNLAVGLMDNGTKLYNASTNTWTRPSWGDGGWIEVDYENENIVYARSNSAILKSTDGGNNYSGIFNKNKWDIEDRFYLDPADHNKLWVPDKGMLKLYNATTNTITTKYTFPYGEIAAVHVAPSNGNIIYAAMDGIIWNDTATIVNKLFKSIDGGETFTDISANCMPYRWWGYIKGFCIDPNNPNRIWAGCGMYAPQSDPSKGVNRVIYSSDGGITWTDISTDLPPFSVNHLVYRNGSDDEIYAGTNAGVYRWNKNLQKWECFNNGFPPVQVTKLVISDCKRKITASTFGRGIWEAPLSPVSTSLWNTNQIISNNIDILTGVTITVTATVSCSNHTITIGCGGKLIVSGGTIDDGNIVVQKGGELNILNNGKILLGNFDNLDVQLGGMFNCDLGEILLK